MDALIFTEMSTIIFPNKLQTIGSNFLKGCSAIRVSLDLNSPNINSIGDNFLSGCSLFGADDHLIAKEYTSKPAG
jgi:hypothetical protein